MHVKKLWLKVKKLQQKCLKLKEDEVEFKDGEFIVAKSNKKKTIGEVAFACYLPGSRYGEVKSPLTRRRRAWT